MSILLALLATVLSVILLAVVVHYELYLIAFGGLLVAVLFVLFVLVFDMMLNQ